MMGQGEEEGKAEDWRGGGGGRVRTGAGGGHPTHAFDVPL